MSENEGGDRGNVRRLARGEQGKIDVLGVPLELKIGEAETGSMARPSPHQCLNKARGVLRVDDRGVRSPRMQVN